MLRVIHILKYVRWLCRIWLQSTWPSSLFYSRPTSFCTPRFTHQPPWRLIRVFKLVVPIILVLSSLLIFFNWKSCRSPPFTTRRVLYFLATWPSLSPTIGHLIHSQDIEAFWVGNGCSGEAARVLQRQIGLCSLVRRLQIACSFTVVVSYNFRCIQRHTTTFVITTSHLKTQVTSVVIDLISVLVILGRRYSAHIYKDIVEVGNWVLVLKNSIVILKLDERGVFIWWVDLLWEEHIDLISVHL